jgi:molecular chaperone GrpE
MMNDDPTRTEPIDDQPPASPAGGDADPSLGDERLVSIERERDEFLNHYRRVAAEFDNYKKRVARERNEIAQRANERLVIDLLPVLDDLERAVQAFDDHDADQVADGVSLVHRALKTLLEKEGIVELDPLGEPFDPHQHEALLQQPADAPEGSVIQVLQKGFCLADRVIRPARVIVAAPKE